MTFLQNALFQTFISDPPVSAVKNAGVQFIVTPAAGNVKFMAFYIDPTIPFTYSDALSHASFFTYSFGIRLLPIPTPINPLSRKVLILPASTPPTATYSVPSKGPFRLLI